MTDGWMDGAPPRARRKQPRTAKAVAPWLDTLTLTQEEHGLDAAPRRLAAEITERGARRRADDTIFGDPTVIEPFGHLSREERALRRLRDIAMSLTVDRPPLREHAVSEPPRPILDAKPLSPVAAESAAPRGLAWASAQAPSREDIEALAAEAFAALPAPFRARCEGVAILVRDFPEQEVLDHLGIKSEFDLLGLYEGVDLTHASVGDAPQDLDRIFLFRRPLLDYWAEHEETLGHLVTHVLVHEIGHHFGLSDEEMEAIEAAAG